MSTQSRTESHAPIRVTHVGRTPQTTVTIAADPTDNLFDLSATAYRVVLGCCTQEETKRNTNHSRRKPAKAKTLVRKKEVIS